MRKNSKYTINAVLPRVIPLHNLPYRLARLLAAMLLGLALSSFAGAADLQIPELGDSSAGLISPAQEYELGQKWLQVFRAQVPTTSDPFLQSYVEDLIRRLATYSELDDRRLEILVIHNPTLNAFAVPGGIIGVHTGLFRYADTEEQFSSVLAHEIAHLSQRHYARRVEQQEKSSAPMMAAMLASIILGMTAGTDAGLAALSAVNAGALEAQLRFSRQMEQEADRLGMETLVRSGMDPYAMSDMFENMLRASRFTRKPPEFLMTHPVTESRVSDSRLRAQQFNRGLTEAKLDYEMVKVRAQLMHEKNRSAAIQIFRDELRGNDYSDTAASYGLALALINNGQSEEAEKIIEPLFKEYPESPFLKVAKADVFVEQENYEGALKILREALKTNPNHHGYNTRIAEVLMAAGQYKECSEVLRAHVKRRPKDDYIWYLLAEVEGLAGNIFEVHLARAQYFKLNGLFDKAEIQLINALKITKSKDEQTRARLQQELKEIRNMRRELAEFG
ncbi:Putative Zn-dependent protease, contains TPR repeats [Alteromonadaceae bacterium Bs31]|nr:Putative Zn-dependent protease, contains TPR repeats [Alteromonadaceae bacterium Bs31]